MISSFCSAQATPVRNSQPMFEGKDEIFSSRPCAFPGRPRTIWEAIRLIATDEYKHDAIIAWDRDTPAIFARFPYIQRILPDRLLLWDARSPSQPHLGGLAWNYYSYESRRYLRLSIRYLRLYLSRKFTDELNVCWSIDGYTDNETVWE
jgi:hypothetical protein